MSITRGWPLLVEAFPWGEQFGLELLKPGRDCRAPRGQLQGMKGLRPLDDDDLKLQVFRVTKGSCGGAEDIGSSPVLGLARLKPRVGRGWFGGCGVAVQLLESPWPFSPVFSRIPELLPLPLLRAVGVGLEAGLVGAWWPEPLALLLLLLSLSFLSPLSSVAREPLLGVAPGQRVLPPLVPALRPRG